MTTVARYNRRRQFFFSARRSVFYIYSLHKVGNSHANFHIDELYTQTDPWKYSYLNTKICPVLVCIGKSLYFRKFLMFAMAFKTKKLLSKCFRDVSSHVDLVFWAHFCISKRVFSCVSLCIQFVGEKIGVKVANLMKTIYIIHTTACAEKKIGACD